MHQPTLPAKEVVSHCRSIADYVLHCEVFGKQQHCAVKRSGTHVNRRFFDDNFHCVAGVSTRGGCDIADRCSERPHATPTLANKAQSTPSDSVRLFFRTKQAQTPARSRQIDEYWRTLTLNCAVPAVERDFAQCKADHNTTRHGTIKSISTVGSRRLCAAVNV